jgi:serine/threonine protein kinase
MLREQVADFGLSKVLDALSVLPGTKTITGTPQYMAPEVMLTQPQGMRVDIYRCRKRALLRVKEPC